MIHIKEKMNMTLRYSFSGFSIISGFEILYWLIFKVLFHKKDKKIEPNSFFLRNSGEHSQDNDNTTCNQCGER